MDSAWSLAMSGCRLLVDPWLEGTEVDYFGWLNTQWHRTAPLPYDELPEYDAVLITQKYPDHCHQATLQRLQPAVIVAPESLKKLLTHLLPDARLHLLGRETRTQQIGSVTVTHLPTRRRIDPIYDAYVLDDGEHRVMVANHGFLLDDGHREQLGGNVNCDVLFSPFNRYVLPALLGGVVAPGMEGLAALVAQVEPRAVLQTHDELKHGRGLVPALARIDVFDPASVAEYPWLKDRFVPISNYEQVTF